jgi:hypothetical protein
MKKKATVAVLGAVMVFTLLVPRQGSAFPFGGFGAEIIYLIRLVTAAKAQLGQLQNTYGLLNSQYHALKSLPQRYQAQFTGMLNFRSSDAYGNVGGIAGVLNAGGDPSGTYGQIASRMNQYALSGMSLDALQRVKSSAAYVQLADGGIQGIMQAIGQQRANSQRIQQQIANLQADSLADGQTALQVAQHQSATQVLLLQQSRDAATTQMLIAQQAAISAMHEREAMVEKINTEIASQQAVPMIPQSVGGSELQTWTMP